MEYVDIRTTDLGQPAAVLRAGQEWRMVVEPVRWFERVSWWERSKRMPRGQGRVDVEVWQVQVCLDSRGDAGIATWELVREGEADNWALRGEEALAA